MFVTNVDVHIKNGLQNVRKTTRNLEILRIRFSDLQKYYFAENRPLTMSFDNFSNVRMHIVAFVLKSTGSPIRSTQMQEKSSLEFRNFSFDILSSQSG